VLVKATSKKILPVIFAAIFPLLISSGNPLTNHDLSADAFPGSFMFLPAFQQDYPNDFGDAPESYGSADHVMDGARYLGSPPDGEASQQYSDEADADDLNGIDDEDGVEFPELKQGTDASIPVRIVAPLLSYVYLNAWIDWNGDGDFEDKNERVASDNRVSNGTYILSVSVPIEAVGNKPVYARFRLGPRSTIAPLYSSTGSAAYGEVEDYMVKITCAEVKIPQASEIIQPSCDMPSGSITLEGLPETGIWTLTRLPDGSIMSGSGTSVALSGIQPGVWQYTVTNQSGCTSLPSEEIVINPAPETPEAPVPAAIVHPTCTISTGSVVLNGLPDTGNWTLIRNPGNFIYYGSGTSITIADLPPGSYFFTVTNTDGCISPPSTEVIINHQPSIPGIPIVGVITQPDCDISTGSVELTGLPSEGTWILTRIPDEVIVTGTGTSIVIHEIEPGTYSFTVTNEDGCTSQQSAEFDIIAHAGRPSAPVIETITQPTCTVSTGSVTLSGLPASGNWSLIRLPDEIVYAGSGISVTVTGLTTGTYSFRVTNAEGCTSDISSDVVINTQPSTPSSPVAGTISHPTCDIPTGSVVITGLPSPGTWILTRYPGTIIVTGSGESTTISDLDPGSYNFTVTNEDGCTSLVSTDVIINPQPGPAPTLVITNPDPVCTPSTVDLTDPDITRGSTANITLTYWKDSHATIPYTTPATATEGTYYIKGTILEGCSDIEPVVVKVFEHPVSDAGPDQVLDYIFNTTLNANLPGENESGSWSVVSGAGKFSDIADANAVITNLALGENELLWSVTNGACPPALDYLMITVNDLLVPTLITPDMNGKNDYFVLQGIGSLGKTGIMIFDRRGVLVFENDDYDNLWNGVDYNGNPLPEDTYFFIINPEKSRSMSGYIVIRR
jgi:gliding motility-associated-like protein